MLYFDADQHPLEGELAGEGGSPPPTPPEDRNGDGVRGQAAGGPTGWKVFGCYDEY